MYKPYLTCLIAALFHILSFTAGAFSAETDPSNIARCKGHGTISFEGSGTLIISGDGVLIVNDNATVTLEDPQYAAKSPDCFATSSNSCIYIALKGNAWVAGEGLKVSFAGANIGLTASGNAKLTLKGFGIYLYDKAIGRWSTDGKGTIINLKN
ncbi:MAG: hypothetical protein WCQ99_03560 [Pseudomonadota bacterium]